MGGPASPDIKLEVIMTKRLIAVAIGIAFVMSAATAEAKHRYKYKKSHYKAAYSHHHRQHHKRYANRTLRGYARSGASTDRGCLTSAAKGLLARIEAKFGRVQIVSTCRPGAVIAGSGRPSMHRYGMAIDFKTSQKAAVVRWLAANNRGGTMTYPNSDHIHADVGRYHFVSLAGQRTRVASASRRSRNADLNADLAWGSGYSDGASKSSRRAARHAARHASRHASRHGGHHAGRPASRGLHSVL
jgi:uncharacterized protein YcbK (DUF882 family)